MASTHKSQLRLQQLTGSLVDLSYSGSQSSAVAASGSSETSLAGILGQFAGAIGRITGRNSAGSSAPTNFTNVTAGHFHQSLHVTGSGLDFNQGVTLQATGSSELKTTGGTDTDMKIRSEGASVLLDGQSGKVQFQDAGTKYLKIHSDGNDVVINPVQANKDIVFEEDGGTEIMRVDSSAESLLMASGKKIQFGSTGEYIYDADSNLEFHTDGDLRSYAGVTQLVSGSTVTLDPGEGVISFTGDSRGSGKVGGSLVFDLGQSDGPTIRPDNGKSLNFMLDDGGSSIFQMIDGGASATDHELRILEGAKVTFANSAGAAEYLSGSNQDILLTARAGVGIYAGGNSSRKLLLDGAAGVSIGTKNATAMDVNSAAFDLDASGAITIDGTSTVSIDGADDMNFTITSSGAGEDLTIQQIGGNDSSIIITAAGTGADAVSIDATAGSMLVAPNLIDGKTLTVGPSGKTQMVFTPHGTAASEKISLTNTAGTADDAISIVATAGGVTVQAGNDSLHIDADGTDADALNIDSAGGMDVDIAGVLDLNAGDDSVVAVTTAAKDLALTVSGGGAQVLQLNSAGTGTNAIDLNATAGGVDIDASGAISIDSSAGSIDVNVVDGQTISIGLNGATEMVLTPHGTPASEKISLINTSGTADDAIKIDSVAGGLLLAAGDDSLHIDADGTDADALNIDSAGGMDVDVAGVLNMAAGDDSVIAVTTSAKDLALTVSGGGAQVLQLNSAGTGTNAIDINATAGGLDVDVAGALDIDANDDSQIVVSASAKDLTVGVSGGGAQVLKLDSAGTGTDAVDINASAGGVDIDASGKVAIDGGSIDIGVAADVAIDIDSSTLDIDASGAITIDGTSTIGIGANAAAGNIDIGTNGTARTITIGNTTGATGVEINAGSGEINIGDSGASQVNIGRSGKDVVIGGNLQVQGATTTVSSSNVTFKDSLIGLGYSGSNTPGTAGDRGILFGRAASASAAQPTFWFDGTNFALGNTITAPNSGSVGTVSAYEALRVERIELDTATNYLDLDTDVKLVAVADVVVDAGGGQVYLADGGTNKITVDLDTLGNDGPGFRASVSGADLTFLRSSDSAKIFQVSNANSSLLMASGKPIEFGSSSNSIKTDGTDLIVDALKTLKLDSADGIWELYVNGTEILNIANASSDVNFKSAVADKDIVFYADDDTEIVRMDGSEKAFVVNDSSSANVDFRVESDGEDEAIFLDASANTLEINKGETAFLTTIHNVDGEAISVTATEVVINDDGVATVDFRAESDGEDEAIFLDASANTLYVNKGNTAFETYIESTNAQAINVTAAGVVFNEEGHATNDFRVESDTEAHALFVDAGANELHINSGETAFLTTIHNVDGEAISVTATEVVINDDGVTTVDFRAESDGEDKALWLDASANELYVNEGETAFTTIIGNTNDEAIRVDATGVVFNEDGHATNDFRVESNQYSHMIFVDSGNDVVGMGNVGGNALLHSDAILNISASNASVGMLRLQGDAGADAALGDFLQVVSGSTATETLAINNEGALQIASAMALSFNGSSNTMKISANSGNDMNVNAPGDFHFQGGGDNPEISLVRGSATVYYQNFNANDASGMTEGSGGFGFRNSAGTMQFKNSGGSWASFASSAGAANKFTASITKTVASGSKVAAASAGLSTFDLSDITPEAGDKQVDVYVNGQMMLTGSDANVGGGSADYYLVDFGSSSDLKFGFVLVEDDVLQISIR